MTGCVCGSFCGRSYGATGCLVEYMLVNYKVIRDLVLSYGTIFHTNTLEFSSVGTILLHWSLFLPSTTVKTTVSLTALKISRFIGLLTCLCYQVRWLQRDNGVSDPNGDRLHVRKVAVRVLNGGGNATCQCAIDRWLQGRW